MLKSLKQVYHVLVAILALIWFKFPSQKLKVIGVTGTDGKTTTATLIYEILKAAKLRVSMISSVEAVIAGKSYDTGFHVTTPNPWQIQKYLFQAVEHNDEYFVLEVTSHALDQGRVFGVNFLLGAITNVTPEHLDWHKTFSHYLNTKLKLLQRAQIAVVNRDEEELYSQAIKSLRRKRYVTYGIYRDANYTPKTFPFKTNLAGIFNRYNCLAAIAVADLLKINKTVIKQAVLNFSGVNGRMEVVANRPFKVIIDFAHTPNALKRVLHEVRTTSKGKLIHVFGSAGLRDTSKRPKMGEASGKYADEIVLTEEDYRTENVQQIMGEIASGISLGKSVYKIPDRQLAIEFALKQAHRGDVVIITGKGHEKSLCRGKLEYPWSDQKAVKTILAKLWK